MHTVNLISSAIQKQNAVEISDHASLQTCAVTGAHCLCIPRKELLGKSFTNGDLLAAPQSEYISLDAYVSLAWKWERASSWYCDGEQFLRLDRKGVRQMVIAGQYGKQWAGYATTSYKKHGSLFAKVNTTHRIWRFEMKDVDCTDHARLLEIWERLNIELRGGMGRTILETLECPIFIMKKIGMSQWITFEKWAKPLYRGALYQFLCYLLPSQEELKNETH